jgi:hypothetical protein
VYRDTSLSKVGVLLAISLFISSFVIFNMVFIVVWVSNAFAAAWSSEMETGIN